MSEAKLRFTTVALRRELPSELHELAPVTAPGIAAYGTEDRTTDELALALSELPDEARPSTVARHLLPEGVRVEQLEIELSRPELPNRLHQRFAVTLVVVIVPEPRPDAGPAGHWVFIPALEHACYVDRKEDLVERVQAELAVLPSALSLDIDGWRRLLTWTPARLERLHVELATTPLAEAKGRKALADAERKRQAAITLDAAGRRLVAPDPAPPLVGRAALLDELGRILDSRGRRGVLLVGEEAAGKSALMLAWAAAHPSRAVWATSAAELVAGASGLGEWQERVAAVLAAAEALDAILYFDDFAALFADRPSEGGVELGAAMRRHIVDGRVRVLGELTAAALDRVERRDVSLVGSMLRLTVPATDAATTIDACHAWAQHWARTQPQRAQIAPAAIATAVELARRYLPYRAFPGKAVRLLEELRVAHDANRSGSGAGAMLGEAELFSAFSWSTGIPLTLLDDTRALAQTEVIAALRRRMVGQEAAVRRVADAIAIAKARLQPGDKPLATLLFVGPSGVGKTELARSLAAYLFNAPDRMVRLDMSEYTDPWAAERLFGGGGDEGRLTSAVRSQPFGVVLLDEIEKAHSSVFDLLLQVLGEARLTDGRGRTTYFHNSIIVLTSNLGTRSARGKLGLSPAGADAELEDRRYRDAVLAAFRPELINRLDQIVVFHPLTPAEISRVAEIAVSRLVERRGFTQSGVIFDVSPRALELLAEGGFSSELGARALRRHLDAAVLAPAARLLAKAGAEGHGGALTVRAPDEPATRPVGARIAQLDGSVTITLWRRASQTGRRLVRSALALGGLRRETDRELAMAAATAVRDKLGELEATLATASRSDGKRRMAGAEIARLSQEHARLRERWTACESLQGELRTAEELCLDALARDVDAVDLIDGAIGHRVEFRRRLFWLYTALQDQAPGITMLVHTPDARAAVGAWAKIVLEAAAHHGWRASVHVWAESAPGRTGGLLALPGGGRSPGVTHNWGPPHDLEWLRDTGPRVAPACLLVRVAGAGAETLLAFEDGLHRFHGLAGEPCHVWVTLLEKQTEFDDEEWQTLPGPPAPNQPVGAPIRELTVGSDRVIVGDEDLEIPFAELGKRLEEIAVARILARFAAQHDDWDLFWEYELPLAALRARRAAEKAAEEKS